VSSSGDEQELDVRGLLCPLPVLKARKRLMSLRAGDILKVIATDPAARIDMPHYCRESGHRFLGEARQDDAWVFRIEKQEMNVLNEYGRLKQIAIRRPEVAFRDDARLDAEWRALNYHSRPDLGQACREYDAFEALLRGTGAELIHLGDGDGLTLDSLYVRDALIVTPKGLVKCHMGKPARRGEPQVNAMFINMPVIGEITPPGLIEGGDLTWLDEKTVIVGIGYRTNMDAVEQLRAILGESITVHAFDLPHYKGRGDVFHLMSVLSPVDEDLAVVYLPLMPVRLVQLLEARGIGFAEVPEAEFPTMGCNVLAIAPRHVVMVEGNPETVRRLEAKGCRVEIIAAEHISRKGEGGPTCMTRPLVRG
jgi:N-dimethylarginine dimethylaminohydrolase/TusA-related sulfurtransferase